MMHIRRLSTNRNSPLSFTHLAVNNNHSFPSHVLHHRSLLSKASHHSPTLAQPWRRHNCPPLSKLVASSTTAHMFTLWSWLRNAISATTEPPSLLVYIHGNHHPWPYSNRRRGWMRGLMFQQGIEACWSSLGLDLLKGLCRGLATRVPIALAT